VILILSRQDSVDSSNGNSTLDVSANIFAPSVPAPTFLLVPGGNTHYLNIPMLYVGAMLKSGKWERYNANVKDLGKQSGTAIAQDRQIGDNSLTACVAIMLISKHGVIYAHVPPYLCPFLPNYKGTQKKDPTKEGEYKQLKSAIKKTFSEYKGELGHYVAHMVLGQVARPDEAKHMMEELFGETLAGGTHIEVDTDPNDLTNLVLIDLRPDPPQLTIKGRHIPVAVPN
jgi:hypothetical protein